MPRSQSTYVPIKGTGVMREDIKHALELLIAQAKMELDILHFNNYHLDEDNCLTDIIYNIIMDDKRL